jgi:hypothetical protein
MIKKVKWRYVLAHTGYWSAWLLAGVSCLELFALIRLGAGQDLKLKDWQEGR